MKNLFLAMVAAGVLLCGHASATESPPQRVAGGSTVSADSQAAASSMSSSQSEGGSASARAEGGYVNVHNSSGRDERQAPSVVPPSVVAVGNLVCHGGVSGGASAPGFGLTIGGTREDEGCALIRSAMFLYNVGQTKAALMLLCNEDKKVAKAIRDVGDTSCDKAERGADTPKMSRQDSDLAFADRIPPIIDFPSK